MLELLSLLNVIHNERVQEARGAQLELRLHGAVGKHRLLDAGHLDVVAAGNFQELLNVLHLLWLSALLASILKKMTKLAIMLHTYHSVVREYGEEKASDVLGCSTALLRLQPCVACIDSSTSHVGNYNLHT